MTDIDIEFLQQWVGKQRKDEDDITLFPAKALAAALNRDVEPKKGDALPPFWEWMYFLPTPKGSETGPDGHPDKSDDAFLPPIPLPRRMWAAGSVEILNPLIIGLSATRTTTIDSVELKKGASGTLVFVNVKHDIEQSGMLCISQVQNIVYREAASEPAALPPGKKPSQEPGFSEMMTIDPVLLFRYSALTYNGHRIHYDREYTMNDELYPALVVHGPLLVTLLLENFQKNVGGENMDQKLRSYSFRASRPTFDVNNCALNGVLIDGSMSLWSTDHEGFQCMSIKGEIA